MSDLFLKPSRPGLIVRDPETGKPLAEEGETKPRNSYWLRRKKDNDVIEATPAKAKAAAEEGKGESK